MKKPFTKIICAAAATVVALGTMGAVGCAQYNNGSQLSGNYHTDNPAVSNGGFAVQKGDYVYFINGVEGNAAENNYGVPVKGSIMRISTDDLKAHNYASDQAVQTVVPQIAYAGNYQGGLFIYGDYIYYSTPSTARTSDGSVLSDRLDLKRTKLDGTESMKNAYVTFPVNTYDFRFVEIDKTVYILYVATSESLYEESTGVTNLHSLNTETGEDVLLAYNISSYLFDSEDKTNPRVYYTMNVVNYAGTSNTNYGYNQVYTVKADEKEPKEYKTDDIIGWDSETDRYINCGDLVFDGVGGRNTEKTPFNYPGDDLNELNFTYTLEQYVNGNLFYTRHTSNNSSEYLFVLKDGDITSSWNPITGNPAQNGGSQLMNNGSSADSYKFIFGDDGSLSAAIYAETDGGISVNKLKDGKFANEMDNVNYYRVVREGTATILLTDGDYLYYSVTGGNGYTFYRVNYTGEWKNYDGMPETDEVSEYTSVQILDLDSVNDWYKPEILAGHLLFASETDSMTTYNYVMAFDLADMSNADIEALNDRYNAVIGDDGLIADYANTSDYPTNLYANLSDATKYLFYMDDIDYVKELAAACNQDAIDSAEEDEKDNVDPVYSDNTLTRLEAFLAPSAENDWKDYTDVKKINGKDVYSNRRDYYYSVLGKMTEDDAEKYRNDLRASYLKTWPEEEETGWWIGLSTVAKVFFIIGMCLAGILVIAAILIAVLVITRKKRENKMPEYTKRRIKVDTTDDKNINVYDDEPSQPASEEEEK